MHEILKQAGLAPRHEPPEIRWVAAIAVLVTVYASPVLGASTDLVPLLQQHRIQPISPPVPAIDFELPTLAGGTMKISDSSGRWVLLTFFATWCGPCATEMPSLQRLHLSSHAAGLDIIAVSGDEHRGPVASFVQRKKMEFPVLLDSDGRIASQYQASSIPVSYLVSPDGQVVGVARGARNWQSMEPLFEALISLVPPTTEETPRYAENTNEVALPANLEPPTAEVSLVGAPPTAGKPFQVDVRIAWAGHFEDYLLHPPQMSLPEQVTQLEIKAQSTTEMGRRVVNYRFVLQADEPGTYALDPIEVRYTLPLEEAPVASRLTGPTVWVAPRRIAGLAPVTFGGTAAGIVIALLVAIFIIRKRNTGSDSSEPDGPAVDPAGLRQSFLEARRLRLSGDIGGFLEGLRTIHQHLNESTASEKDETNFEPLIEQTRYAGQPPAPQDLDKLQRRVELRIAELAPDQNASARESIEFANEP